MGLQIYMIQKPKGTADLLPEEIKEIFSKSIS